MWSPAKIMLLARACTERPVSQGSRWEPEDRVAAPAKRPCGEFTLSLSNRVSARRWPESSRVPGEEASTRASAPDEILLCGQSFCRPPVARNKQNTKVWPSELREHTHTHTSSAGGGRRRCASRSSTTPPGQAPRRTAAACSRRPPSTRRRCGTRPRFGLSPPSAWLSQNHWHFHGSVLRADSLRPRRCCGLSSCGYSGTGLEQKCERCNNSRS